MTLQTILLWWLLLLLMIASFTSKADVTNSFNKTRAIDCAGIFVPLTSNPDLAAFSTYAKLMKEVYSYNSDIPVTNRQFRKDLFESKKRAFKDYKTSKNLSVIRLKGCLNWADYIIRKVDKFPDNGDPRGLYRSLVDISIANNKWTKDAARRILDDGFRNYTPRPSLEEMLSK